MFINLKFVESFMIRPLEPALGGLRGLLLDVNRAVELLNSVSIFISTPSHHIFFHFELQAAIVVNQAFVFAIFVFSDHQRRITVFVLVASSIFYELFEHLVF